MTGTELARTFYTAEVAPLLTGVPHAAALLGSGSEVLGYDDDVSVDHDFGPRVQVLLPGPAPSLPAAAEVSTAAQFFTARLGVDPAAGFEVADWLVTPTAILAGLSAGAVFHDPGAVLAGYRDVLRWYPDDVWRYALAAGWLKVGQEEPFIARTGSTGDDLGSRLVTARLVRELVRLCFLLHRRWAPYPKWLGRAFAGLPIAARVGPALDAALAATHWREREAAFGTAAALIAEATNDLRLCPPVDAALRPFHTRDIRILGAERFTVALASAITDPDLRALLERLGTRDGIPRLPGTVDHLTDSTDVLAHPARFRAAGPSLGLMSESFKTGTAAPG